ncbi:MAG: MFS transporter [Nitrospinae bacterium]|nr:MFS transporter [Nitrospinota bacterium]
MGDPRPRMQEKPQGSYRYLIVLIGFVTLAAASGVSTSFSVFYSTLLREFAWSHAGGASVYSVNMLVLAAGGPLMGWVLDRFGPRWLFSGAATLIGAAWIACGTLRTLGQFMLFYGVASALGQTALLSMTVVVSRWFEQRQRGRAIGFADVGTGFGHVVFVPGSAWLIATFGWQTAFVLVGIVVIAVLVPLNLLHRPAPTASTRPAQRASTFRGALCTRAFWMLAAAHLYMSVTMTMVNVHLVEFLVGTGTLQILGASTIFSAVSLVSLGGRAFFGWLADRLKGEGAFSVAMSCTMTGYVMLLLLGALRRWPLYTFVLSYGFAQGAGGIAIAAKTVEVFQGPRLGTIFMVVMLSANLGAAFGAWIGGRLFDLTGSYTLTFATAIASGVLAIACMWAGRSRAQWGNGSMSQ